MGQAPNPTSSRKRKTKTKVSKTTYREYELLRRLRSYRDQDRVLKLLDQNEMTEFPREFVASAEGYPALRVTIDWLGVRSGLERWIDILTSGRSSNLTAEKLSQIKKYRSTGAALYVLEFLPEVVGSALANLYHEAYTKVSADKGSSWARTGAEVLGKFEYQARMERLEIHEGPKARFRHRSEYETALDKAIDLLVREGRKVTQENVAEKLAVGSNDAIDLRVIRRWNKEFGVNWKMLVKQAIKADKS